MAINEKATAIGLRQVHVGVRDSDGTMKVPDGTPVGTAYPGIRALKARALTITPAEPQRISASGDDAVYYTFQESPDDVPSGELRTQISDTALIALMTSTKDFGSGDQSAVVVGSDKIGQEESLIIWGSRKAVDTDTGQAHFGNTIYETYILLNAIASARPSGMERSTIGEFVWSIAANNSAVDQFGRTFTEAIHGCTEAPFVIVHTRHPFFMDKFEGNGTETEFTLTKGTSVIHDAPTTSPIRCFVDGVETAVTVDASGVATISPAPADGAAVVIQYEYSLS
jgi:hypothetical protein